MIDIAHSHIFGLSWCFLERNWCTNDARAVRFPISIRVESIHYYFFFPFFFDSPSFNLLYYMFANMSRCLQYRGAIKNFTLGARAAGVRVRCENNVLLRGTRTLYHILVFVCIQL